MRVRESGVWSLFGLEIKFPVIFSTRISNEYFGNDCDFAVYKPHKPPRARRSHVIHSWYNWISYWKILLSSCLSEQPLEPQNRQTKKDRAVVTLMHPKIWDKYKRDSSFDTNLWTADPKTATLNNWGHVNVLMLTTGFVDRPSTPTNPTTLPRSSIARQTTTSFLPKKISPRNHVRGIKSRQRV